MNVGRWPAASKSGGRSCACLAWRGVDHLKVNNSAMAGESGSFTDHHTTTEHVTKIYFSKPGTVYLSSKRPHLNTRNTGRTPKDLATPISTTVVPCHRERAVGMMLTLLSCRLHCQSHYHMQIHTPSLPASASSECCRTEPVFLFSLSHPLYVCTPGEPESLHVRGSSPFQ